MLQESDLNQFVGTEQYYRHWTRLLYTDGVQYVAQEGGAYWLIDAIASWQLSPKVTQDPMLREIQLWTLKVNSDKSATLSCQRDADDVAFTQEIEYTDFPLSEVRFYLTQGVLMLPSEY
jgi:hypothetical protein